MTTTMMMMMMMRSALVTIVKKGTLLMLPYFLLPPKIASTKIVYKSIWYQNVKNLQINNFNKQKPLLSGEMISAEG